MAALDDSGNRLAAVQMNTELRNAQLEILSAQCATDRLRLRYSAHDLARHAQRDILRKAWTSAGALFEYYNNLLDQLPDRHTIKKAPPTALEEARILEAGDHLARYLKEQSEYFRPIGRTLDPEQQAAMDAFFSPELIARARLAVVDRQSIPKPPLHSGAAGPRIPVLPEVVHPFSATFSNVLLFHAEVTDRRLFHALVHTVQMEVLGVETYAERFVRGLLRTRAHSAVPLEMHATMLENTFAEHAQPFLVEEKVRLWVNQGRY